MPHRSRPPTWASTAFSLQESNFFLAKGLDRRLLDDVSASGGPASLSVEGRRCLRRSDFLDDVRWPLGLGQGGADAHELLAFANEIPAATVDRGRVGQPARWGQADGRNALLEQSTRSSRIQMSQSRSSQVLGLGYGNGNRGVVIGQEILQLRVALRSISPLIWRQMVTRRVVAERT